jgi:hypothetical protein
MRTQYGLAPIRTIRMTTCFAAAAYLKWLHGKYGYPKMFAAYNAGPGTLEAQMSGKRKLPAETQAYVKGIARILGDNSTVVAAGDDKASRISATYMPAEPVKPIATFTRPDGSSVTIDGANVIKIRAALPDEYAPGVQTVIAIGTMNQGVREDIATVTSLLKHRPTNV